jgi:hypothetical protein
MDSAVSRETLGDVYEAVVEQVEIGAKYAGYIERQKDEIQRAAHYENLRLPAELDYMQVAALSIEVRQKLSKHRPETLGLASRISGVTPAAISLLLVHLKKNRFKGFGDFGLRRVTAQGKPDRDADTNRGARDSGHRAIHITRRDENHGESMLLRFLAQSQDIELRRLRPQHRMVDEIRYVPIKHHSWASFCVGKYSLPGAT